MRFDLMLLPSVETGGEEGTTIKKELRWKEAQ